MTETPQPSRRSFRIYETPSPRISYSDMMEGMCTTPNTKNDSLMCVLEQVSELTMDDDAFNGCHGPKTPVLLNPRPAARATALPMLDEDADRKPSPTFSGRKKSRRNSPSTPAKLSTAPQIPSSPDLSAGGVRPIPPQFSPIGSSQVVDIHCILQQRGSMIPMDDDDMMSSPTGYPTAPPPTPQNAPPMPWMETPEPAPRKKVVLTQSLQMKKGQFCFQ